ncbi:MAG: hypothetical protein A2750_01450 [Candidatus Yanofskybacteria bacterium RIFCSPHIGHO2_01_FULL_45_42]|uniref:Uncharacterized protein n=1 Tax=Candidatus Yanofskybacteria bacterium RIFCSPHIGHO2_01_FULL_45_42 TaxID=1802671 RepID=A0A1F8F658_9BACT|nr:MAG: hypothetical protein A2750_01450 [Candidatus Yanofskybacteria bacterium RIFCSPHIGHO2_01_FULL_45_42]
MTNEERPLPESAEAISKIEESTRAFRRELSQYAQGVAHRRHLDSVSANHVQEAQEYLYRPVLPLSLRSTVLELIGATWFGIALSKIGDLFGQQPFDWKVTFWIINTLFGLLFFTISKRSAG